LLTFWRVPRDELDNGNLASDDWCCPTVENDLRAGGRYKARMESKDGSFDFEASTMRWWNKRRFRSPW